jgi:hypothetical protein
VIARRQTEHGSGSGRYRWVVERTFPLLHNFKRLLVRHERSADITTRLFALGCCPRLLQPTQELNLKRVRRRLAYTIVVRDYQIVPGYASDCGTRSAPTNLRAWVARPSPSASNEAWRLSTGER